MSRLTVVRIIQDRRRLFDYQPGDIGQPAYGTEWFMACPGCGCIQSLASWQVILVGDHMISINPSILCHGCSIEGCGAHYIIERSRIRWM